MARTGLIVGLGLLLGLLVAALLGFLIPIQPTVNNVVIASVPLTSNYVQPAVAQGDKPAQGSKKPVVAQGDKPTQGSKKPVVAQGDKAPKAPATCPVGSEVAKPVASDEFKCDTGRASLVFCVATVGAGGLDCYREYMWNTTKTPDVALIENVTHCDLERDDPILPKVGFTITQIKTLHGTLLQGSGQISILNSGDCTTTRLTSLLLLLERSASGGSGNSVGPGGENHKLLSTVGVESSVVHAGCDEIQPADTAHICTSSGSTPCDTPVVYANGLQITSDPSDLTLIPISTSSLCSDATNITVDFVFPLDASDLALLALNFTGYRINILATFDACCERGSACGIDVDCDGDYDTVRTVQTRSPSFDIRLNTCEARCNCAQLSDIPELVPSDGCSLLYDFPQSPNLFYDPALQCGNSSVHMYLPASNGKFCCMRTTDDPYVCNLDVLTVANHVFYEEQNDCTSLLGGASLVQTTPVTAETDITCECIKEECPEGNPIGKLCTFPDRCEGTTDCTDICTAYSGICAVDGICECPFECGSGEMWDDCGVETFCGIVTECPCTEGLVCGEDDYCECAEECQSSGYGLGEQCVFEFCDERTECSCTGNLVCGESDSCEEPNQPPGPSPSPTECIPVCDSYDCIYSEGSVENGCGGYCEVRNCDELCKECSASNTCDDVPNCDTSAPACTYTIGAWKQERECLPKNMAECQDDDFVDPTTTKPACVDASCYADRCVANGNTPFFYFGHPNGDFQVAFNPCPDGDLFSLVKSFMDVHTGPASYMVGVPNPPPAVWAIVGAQDTGAGILGAQLVAAKANGILIQETFGLGEYQSYLDKMVDLSCASNDNSTDIVMTISQLMAVTDCLVSTPPPPAEDPPADPLVFLETLCYNCFVDAAPMYIICDDTVIAFSDNVYSALNNALTDVTTVYHQCSLEDMTECFP